MLITSRPAISEFERRELIMVSRPRGRAPSSSTPAGRNGWTRRLDRRSGGGAFHPSSQDGGPDIGTLHVGGLSPARVHRTLGYEAWIGALAQRWFRKRRKVGA
ncbi:MAG TPA: hypothetical protein VHO29_06470 [Marmoricola sp.]|nr:hypothetical protein [Marmoricola sp.]